MEFLKFEREEFLIPVCRSHRAIDHDAECLHLRGRPFVAENHRDLREPQLVRRLSTEDGRPPLRRAANEAGNFESELPDRGTHPIDRCVVLARIACLRNQLVGRPERGDLRVAGSGLAACGAA